MTKLRNRKYHRHPVEKTKLEGPDFPVEGKNVNNKKNIIRVQQKLIFKKTVPGGHL
jgi:hypothetical protein